MVVEGGVTVIVPPIIAPGFQVYEIPPEALRVEEEPAHTFVGDAMAVKVGPLNTANATVAELVHPPEFPITV